MAEEKQDGQKTIVAFVVGLLIGGMLVWAFSGPADDIDQSDDKVMTEEAGDAMETADTMSESDTEEAPTLSVGEGKIVVANQAAGSRITIDSATYPVSEGWIAVRDYSNEELGWILGAARFSESQGLVPEEISLLRPTTPGREYAIVIFTEDGDREFNLATDVQIDTVFDTFTAE